MTDRDRLVKIVRERWNWRNSPESVADALLAEGMTLPPQPSGPVTSEEAVRAFIVPVDVHIGRASERVGHINDDALMAYRIGLDAAMPLLARDHGYVKAGAASPASGASLTPAEVERRARAWADDYNLSPRHESALVAALTREAK